MKPAPAPWENDDEARTCWGSGNPKYFSPLSRIGAVGGREGERQGPFQPLDALGGWNRRGTDRAVSPRPGALWPTCGPEAPLWDLVSIWYWTFHMIFIFRFSPFFFLGFLSFSAKPAARPRGPELARHGPRSVPTSGRALAHFWPGGSVLGFRVDLVLDIPYDLLFLFFFSFSLFFV